MVKAMYRALQKELIQWQKARKHEPILLHGACQVGKTFLIEHVAKENFQHFMNINFELMPEMCGCFDDIAPKAILANIKAITRQAIIPGKTLLFFDEIQL